MGDLLAQLWLALTRRTLTYAIAIISLGLGVAAFICLSAFSQSFASSLKQRVGAEREAPGAAIEPGEEFSLERGPSVRLQVTTERTRLDAQHVYEQARQAVGSDLGATTMGTYDVKVGRRGLPEMHVFTVSSEWLRLQPHFWGIEDTIAGRLFTPEDDRSGQAVCVIDQRLAHALPAGVDPVGQTLSVNGRPFRVVGLVRHSYDIGNYGLLILSFTASYPLLRIQPPDGVSLLMSTREAGIESEMNRLQGVVSRALGGEYKVSVSSPWVDLQETRYQLAYMGLFLRLLTLLPLSVGLLGLVSMLLANLGVRVREIGLHRALGATAVRQASLVLCEAGLMGLLASLVGIPVGMAVLRVLAATWRSELRASPEWIVLAVLASTVASLLVGLIPARAALRISPSEVLNAE